jgi:hypothetical protein
MSTSTVCSMPMSKENSTPNSTGTDWTTENWKPRPKATSKVKSKSRPTVTGWTTACLTPRPTVTANSKVTRT